MNRSGIRVIILESNPREKACVSLLSFCTRMGCCSISADKRQVCGEWKRLGGKLTGDIMKIYVGIDMAKDKFDYCAMDDTLNILCRGSNKENRNERFRELSDLIRNLKSTSTMMKIGMESTGIYHIPLYNHLRAYGFSVRILNGLEVRGMKKSRVRKTTNDTIDAESIAKHLMIREEKDTFVVPENFRNIRGIITAYSIVVLNLLNSVSWW